MPKKSSPKNLPKVKKAELKRPENFEEEKTEASRERARTTWIIVFAFVILAVFGAIVWFVLSGRSDQKIHGENLKKFNESSENVDQDAEPQKD